MNEGEEALGAQAARASAGPFTRPRLAIPCRVAPQQSPTPFHQANAVYHLAVDNTIRGTRTEKKGRFDPSMITKGTRPFTSWVNARRRVWSASSVSEE